MVRPGSGALPRAHRTLRNDEDATAWYDYLVARGYEVRLYGDEFSPYPRWDGPATVDNVRRAVRAMAAATAGPDDRAVFVTSSHGSGDGRGSSYLCLLTDPAAPDADARAGRYWDRDLAADLGPAARGRAFVFLDACFSGGLAAELLAALPRVVGTTTCTRKGYGYDQGEVEHGAWTQAFLVQGLGAPAGAAPDADLGALFRDRCAAYVRTHPDRGDRPCLFARLDGGRAYDTEARPDDAAALPPLPLADCL